MRQCEVDALQRSGSYQALRSRYPVVVVPQNMAGVPVEVFTPAQAISARNLRRVLINVHGGGFIHGWRVYSHLESIPIASVGGVKVISVNYRLAPDHHFPAATEDIVTVYRELLKSYEPASIGIYGCSAGALLTAEVVARLVTSGLPLPGAVGMLCNGASYWTEGDTGYLGQEIFGNAIEWGTSASNPYFKDTSPNDSGAFPIWAPSILGKFPPSLLMSGTRDPGLSSVVETHSILVREGVDAELHVWEGLGHGFFYQWDLPQSRECFDAIVRFFDRHLAAGP